MISTGRQVETFYELYHTYCFGPSVDPVSGNKNWGWGGGCVTLNYVDLFPTKTGEPARYRNWIAQNGHKGSENNTPFVDRDPRLSESVMVIGGKPFRGRQPEMWIGGTERGEKNAGKAITGFCIRKFFWDFNPETYHYKPVCSPYLRLAELCLTYAEALNETGQTDEAKIWLNKTRNRPVCPTSRMPNWHACIPTRSWPRLRITLRWRVTNGCVRRLSTNELGNFVSKRFAGTILFAGSGQIFWHNLFTVSPLPGMPGS